MDWAEICFETSHAAMEAAGEIFLSLGASGVVVEDPALLNRYIDSGLWDYTDLQRAEATDAVKVLAYLPQDAFLEEALGTFSARTEELRAGGVDTGAHRISWRTVRDEDWAENWKQYFHTEKIGSRIVIQPTWEMYTPAPGEIPILLDPGAAFGTGSHATTAMCIRFLEELNPAGKRVFDVGCGSGILAIAAAKLGAREVLAKDYDRTALHVAEENVRQNGAEGVVSVGATDLWSDFEGKADLITANLIADLVLRLLPDLSKYLEAGGTLVASGIIEERVEEIREVIAAAGLVLSEVRTEKEWVCLTVRLEESV